MSNPEMGGRASLRVMFMTTGLDTGGAELMLYRLLGAWPSSEIHATVVSLRDRGTIGSRIASLGVPVSTLNLNQPWRWPGAAVRLASVIHRFRPEVFAGWMYHGNLLATLTRGTWRSRTPVVWNIRQTLYDIALERPLTRRVIQAGARLSRSPAAIVYNSTVAARQHREAGFRPRRERVIPNGFDCDVFRPDPNARVKLRASLGLGVDTPLVGHLARFHPMKDHATFLECAARMVASGSKVQFICAGKGVDSGNHELSDTIARLGLSGRMHLRGELSDPVPMLSSLDVLCSSSSRGEGFPNVVGEAMACGVPCVVTDVGDCAMVVGGTGLVTPPQDPEGLAVACARLLGESGAAWTDRSLQARGRITAHFSLSAVAAQYADLLHEVQGSPARTEGEHQPQ